MVNPAHRILAGSLFALPNRDMLNCSFTQAFCRGWNAYPPGKYEYIVDLTVTEKPIYPTVSSVVNPGQHAFTSQKAKIDFLLYLPETYGKNPEAKWPLIIYLHDAEWRGTSPEILRPVSTYPT